MAGVSVLCAVLLLLLAAWLLKCAQGRWLAPGPFFALYWAGALALPQIIAPDYTFSHGAIWYIVMLVGCFCAASYFTAMKQPVRPAGVEPRPFYTRGLRRFIALGTVTGFMASVLVQVANGYSLGSILSASALLDAAAKFSVERYAGQTQTPPLVPLLLAFTYAAALVAPIAARGLPRARAAACYLGPAAGATMYAVLTTARLGMLTVGFLLFAGWITSRTYELGETPRIGFRMLIGSAAAAMLLAAAFVSIAFLRVGSFGSEIRGVIADKMVVYALGYMPAFSQWFEQSAQTFPQTWGTETFAGAVPAGVAGSAAYDAFVPTGTGQSTNIFTIWRYLLQDYGFAIAPVAAVLLGCIATAAWRRVIEKPGAISMVVLVAAYVYTLNGTTQTAFLFTNVVLAMVIAARVLNRKTPEPRVVPELPHVRAARVARERVAVGGPG